MGKKERLLIIGIILISLIMGLIAIVLIRMNNKNGNNKFLKSENKENATILIDDYGKLENNGISRASYFDINACMNQYLNILNNTNFIYRESSESEIKQSIYNLLSEQYIKQNGITVDNVYNFIRVINENTVYVPLEAEVIQDSTVKSFLIHGLIENHNLEVIDDFFAVVNIDAAHELFSIEPIYDDYSSIKEIKIENFESNINNNGNNIFNRESISYENVAKDYINIYKRLSMGSPKTMYNLLDEEYRNARFGNEEEFEKYVQSNREKIYGIRVEKYQATVEDDYTQYVCIDQYNNYYIFREKAKLNYTVILDQHTIDLPEFIEKYNMAKDENKVAMNLEKIEDAINTKDYKYVYGKLDETFKNNNFPTLEQFEEFIKENFFESNNFVYNDIKNQNGIYMYKALLGDATGEFETTTIYTFVMQLKEGTDFVMSFSMDE